MMAVIVQAVILQDGSFQDEDGLPAE